MADETLISWADSTFNPWIGCTKVGPACDGCYAQFLMETRLKRVVWGAPGAGDGTRDRTGAANWRKPKMWNRLAAHSAGRHFVFCSSLADVFDNAVPTEWRRDLFDLIRETPNLTWLLLTKRPGNIIKLFADTLPTAADKRDAALREAWPRNAAIGCTVVNQEEADRDVPKLLAAKAALNPAFAFLSMEPLLGPVDLTALRPNRDEDMTWDALTDTWSGHREPWFATGLDWIITGGETDQGDHLARPSDPQWFRSLRDQCADAGVPFHFKQWGEWQPFMGQVSTRHRPAQTHLFDMRLGAAPVFKFGKEYDPCTLDGVEHFARPEVVR